MIKRRTLLASGAAVLAAPSLVRAESESVLRFVPQADLSVLDPVWTTTYQTRDHGFLVFDTLFGVDEQYRAQPQMAEGSRSDDGGKSWTITLRDGLKFQDGTPVLAKDCAASVKRWGARDAFGQALLAATDEISAPDDKTLVFRLKRPFPLLPDALAKTPPSMCPIMPERLAVTDPYKQVTEMVGSGPYRYIANERVSGSRVVYEKFAGYVPRSAGVTSGTAGPKVAHFDRVEWRIIPDEATVAGALQTGEVDWWLTPGADWLPSLRKASALKVAITVPTGLIATMRFNQLLPPFDNAAVRRAMVHAVKQADYMMAMVGTDPSLWHDGVGFFCPGTPMASGAGLENVTGPRDISAEALKQAGYGGEKIALLAPTDIASAKALADVTADLLHKMGANVDYQAMDWATLVQRRAKQTPIDQGGWSIYHTSWAGTDQMTPAGHVFLRGNGKAATVGWPSSPQLEALRDAWFLAPDEAGQKRICEQMQMQAFQDVPYVPLGQYLAPTAYRADLSAVLNGNPVFWGVRRG